MRFLAGVIGAVLGAVLGGALTILIIAAVTGSDEMSGVFDFMFYGPVGLLIGAVLGIIVALRVHRYVPKGENARLAHAKKLLLVVSLVVGAPVLALGMISYSGHFGDPPPDKALLSNFQRHHATFEQLAQMTQNDKGLSRVGDNWTLPSDPLTIGVSTARIAHYRQLCRSAGLTEGFQADPDAGGVDFYYWGRGSAISSDIDKGYAYLTKPPAHLLNNLDHCQPDEDKDFVAYRHIEGNWYLYYEYIPG